MHREIYEYIGHKLLISIDSTLDLIKILKCMREDLQDQIIWEVIFKSPAIIVIDILQYLDEKKNKVVLLDKVIDKLPDKIESAQSLANILSRVSESLGLSILNELGYMLPALVNTDIDLAKILSSVKDNLQSVILDKIREKLPSIIKSYTDFRLIFDHVKSYAGIGILFNAIKELDQDLANQINICFEEHGCKNINLDNEYSLSQVHDELLKSKISSNYISDRKTVNYISRNIILYGNISDGIKYSSEEIYLELLGKDSTYSINTMLRILEMELEINTKEKINGREVDIINIVENNGQFRKALKD